MPISSSEILNLQKRIVRLVSQNQFLTEKQIDQELWGEERQVLALILKLQISFIDLRLSLIQAEIELLKANSLSQPNPNVASTRPKFSLERLTPQEESTSEETPDNL